MKRKELYDIELLLSELDRQQLCDFIRVECANDRHIQQRFLALGNGILLSSKPTDYHARIMDVIEDFGDRHGYVEYSKTSRLNRAICEIIDEADIDRSTGELRGMITAAPVNDTEIFEVVVTSTDPDEAERIANAITKILPKRISEVVDGSSVRIVDYAVKPSARSGPSYTKNTVIGMLAGIVLSGLIIVIREMYDVFIREEEYLSDTYGIPVLAAIPDTSERSSGGYRYGKYSKYSYKSSYYYGTSYNTEEEKKNG